VFVVHLPCTVPLASVVALTAPTVAEAADDCSDQHERNEHYGYEECGGFLLVVCA